MKSLLTLLAVPALLGPLSAGRGQACDLATVVDAFYCKYDALILVDGEPGLTRTLYTCPTCELRELEPGTCGTCEVALAKHEAKVPVCVRCERDLQPREACVKTYHQCPRCLSTAPRPGACPACEVAREKVSSRALVEYACAACEAPSRLPATCADPQCERFGTPMARRCTLDGTPPHGTPPPPDEPAEEPAGDGE